MLVAKGKSLLLACASCEREASTEELVLVWRRATGRRPRQCYMVHEGCIEDFAKRVLLTDKEVHAWKEGEDVTFDLTVASLSLSIGVTERRRAELRVAGYRMGDQERMVRFVTGLPQTAESLRKRLDGERMDITIEEAAPRQFTSR